MNKILLLLIPPLSFFACEVDKLVSNDPIEQKVDSLLAQMTLAQKIGQTAQRGTSSRVKGGLSEALKTAVREGRIGSMINVMNKGFVDELQHIAVEESPNGIPLIFARDVIHGFKTIFPIPLGQAATWNPELVEVGARVAAIEASTYGVRWTFAPMLDIARDPRWGRIAESPGEDPYLASVLSAAYVRGFQGNDLTDPSSMIACAKHFVGYGAAEGGRDYNTAIIHEPLLRNVYFPPFQKAVEAGVQTFMSGFNELNGVPVSGNQWILGEVLRQEWKFDGFVVSDWNSVTEMIDHGYCTDEKEAAFKAAMAGLDMEMTSQAYEQYLEVLIAEGRIDLARLNRMVRAILRVKFRMGLFDQPYRVDRSGAILSQDHLAKAKEIAAQSMVLLKNDKQTLPITQSQKIAVIGPLADAPLDQLGTWIFDGDQKDSVTPVQAFKEELETERLRVEAGLAYSRDRSKDQFSAAVRAARASDVVLFFGGEEAILSGEAHSRAHLNLPGVQEELIRVIKDQTDKPIVLIIQAGRPIVLANIIDQVDAILMAWHPGTMAGPAVVDILTGAFNPSGRLPVTWPKSVGQIPIYYNHKNTGRPADSASFVGIDNIPVGAWQSSLGNDSHYLDDGFTPQYPFGYGLSYTNFSYSNLNISQDVLSEGDTLKVTFDVTNAGTVAGVETAQLYMRDHVASLTRPIKELKRFARVSLSPNETKKVELVLSTNDLRFYKNANEWVLEPGVFSVYVGGNAQTTWEKKFRIK
ncbi:glycoside hydrolase family 3 C-terminal domain-containing protein [Reichenbachiella carrageenanivorans]|uniref:Glycoside hydrolase family 3 C-terminal domain-containing protein n=1 Tax=Reichenbachiella carrageenanivorans TaxID=2979869 RepID=A0ABY6CWE5_9BACT|nr:glycoside hydrolase family 3 N-terminal domain-containing protein [Reichenbachiella carrageenanivorans]UXX78237.1 glycoside hydrolase family 3 C-terminal domain-containing protein [Reichenbachiella carrageenanivorans]